MQSDPNLLNRMTNNISLGSCPAPTDSSGFQRLIKGELEDFIKKKILKSDYEDIVNKFKNSN